MYLNHAISRFHATTAAAVALHLRDPVPAISITAQYAGYPSPDNGSAAAAAGERGRGWWVVYLHGGAFRDPAITSLSLLPSLPHIFSSSAAAAAGAGAGGSGAHHHHHHHIAGVASLNYRLCDYPGHGTDPWPPPPTPTPTPGDDEEEEAGRGIKWPMCLEDVRDALVWLGGGGDEEEAMTRGGGKGKGEVDVVGRGCMAAHDWIVVGHSVGATMGMILAMEEPAPGDGKWGGVRKGRRGGGVLGHLKGVVGMEGVYDFVALRDHHLEYRDVYDEFTTAAFGPESEGGWERGDLINNGENVRKAVEVVVLGHSKRDALVEEGQSERMAEALGVGGRYTHKGLEVKRVECEGGHDEVVEKGVAVGRRIDVAVEALRERQSKRGKEAVK